MKFSRDSLLWTLGLVASIIAYLMADGRNPMTWDYTSWLKFIAAAVAVLMAKLGNSPLEGRRTLKARHPHQTVMLWALAVILPLTMACATTSATKRLQVAQVSHDSLALAQDLEANLCWGVPDVFHAPADRSHCTAPVAATIKLTDARHQSINTRLAQAFSLHAAITRQLQQGITVDLSGLSQLIAAIIAELHELQQTPDVVHLISVVQAGDIKS